MLTEDDTFNVLRRIAWDDMAVKYEEFLDNPDFRPESANVYLRRRTELFASHGWTYELFMEENFIND